MKTQMDPTKARELNAQLSTPRLVLEPIVARHAGALFELMQDEAIYQWISASPPKSIEVLEQWWAEGESRLNPAGDEAWLNWAVRRTSDGSYVGKLDACVDTTNVATNVGYLFFPKHWGQGYASESVAAMVEHLVAQGIHKLIATVTLGNAPSYRVLEKAGFVQTRVIPDNDTIRGVAYDDLEFIRAVRS